MLTTAKINDSVRPATGDMLGYSFTELLVILALMSILAAQAAPAFQQTIGKAKQRAQSHALHDAIQRARLTAATEGVTMTLCPLANGASCGNDWSLGWQLLRPPSGEPTELPVTLNEQRIADPQIKITANRRLFQFDPSGRSTNGTVLFCASGSPQPLAVIVSYTGKSRVSQPDPQADSACD